MPERYPWHPRALELFRQGYDVQLASALAADEHRLSLEHRERLDSDERPRPPSEPPGRMVGAERGRGS